ncbi:MAG: DUF1850 domain-containing protein [Paracoccaceae bacterium]
MTACLIIAAAAVQLAGAEFELSWEHSVEKTIWRETWVINGDALELREAAVKGSGAGMDPGEGAVLGDGWWVWAPNLPPVEKLVLAASGATAGGWRLCSQDICREVGISADAPITVSVCPK